jgi:hypothetical protein
MQVQLPNRTNYAPLVLSMETWRKEGEGGHRLRICRGGPIHFSCDGVHVNPRSRVCLSDCCGTSGLPAYGPRIESALLLAAK